MNARERRRLAREVAALDRAGEAQREAMVRAYRPGKHLFWTNWLTVGQALADPTFGPGTKDALTAAFASAHGIGPGLLCECWSCGNRWAPDRVPALVLTITLDDEAGGIGLLCKACGTLGDAELERLVVRGLERDFGLTDPTKVSTADLSPEAGRA
jgi:hypothetical protein